MKILRKITDLEREILVLIRITRLTKKKSRLDFIRNKIFQCGVFSF